MNLPKSDSWPIKALEAHTRPPQRSKVSTDTTPSELVVLFHGYGADAYDLYPLHEVISWPQEAFWLFPQGPHQVPIGPGWMGRAWWPLRLEELQKLNNGEKVSFRDIKPEGLDHLTENLIHWLENTGYPWNQISLGGFSQGAMLATQIFCTLPVEKKPKYLLLFSGALINASFWQQSPPSSSTRVWISHGQQDPILAFDHLGELKKLLTHKACEVKTFSFEGGHEIPPQVIHELNHWLTEKACKK